MARKIGEFKVDPAHGSFSAWLMQLTRWRIADQWRKRGTIGQATEQVTPGHSPTFYPSETGSTGPLERIPDPMGVALDATWQQEWERHLMTEALERVKQQISPRQFQMFDLHVLQQQSVQATARLLQSSMASVYMAKHRVGRLLKKELQKLEQNSH